MRKREIQAAVILGDNATAVGDVETLSWSAASKDREGWFKRLESGRSSLLLSDRNNIFETAAPARQSRILIPLADDGLLLWESLRRSPEGLSCAITSSETARNALLSYTAGLDQIEKPEIAVLEEGILPNLQQAEEWFSSPVFDRILIREPLKKRLALQQAENPEKFFSLLASSAKLLLDKDGSMVILCSPPSMGQRISCLISRECECSSELSGRLEEAENTFFSSENKDGAGLNWDKDVLINSFEAEGFSIKQLELIEQEEERLISIKDINVWFDRENSRWGSFIGKMLEPDEFLQIKDSLQNRIGAGPVFWKWKSLLLRAQKG